MKKAKRYVDGGSVQGAYPFAQNTNMPSTPTYPPQDNNLIPSSSSSSTPQGTNVYIGGKSSGIIVGNNLFVYIAVSLK